jgi:hypothetical protein
VFWRIVANLDAYRAVQHRSERLGLRVVPQTPYIVSFLNANGLRVFVSAQSAGITKCRSSYVAKKHSGCLNLVVVVCGIRLRKRRQLSNARNCARLDAVGASHRWVALASCLVQIQHAFQVARCHLHTVCIRGFCFDAH